MNLPSEIRVGIMKGKTVEINFLSRYYSDNQAIIGRQTFSIQNNKIVWNGKNYDKIEFCEDSKSNTEIENLFEVRNVIIGIDFHWQHTENQTFTGNITLIINEGLIQIINTICIEKYLESVIASEMSATSSLPLLKAHAVISRSWAISQILKKKNFNAEKRLENSENEIIKWWENDSHSLFDVCADDHCQRYQGKNRVINKNVQTAINETNGEILTFENKICDTRFSKCCGGITEKFSSCWENSDMPYLVAQTDDENGDLTNISSNENTVKWIKSHPKCFCNCNDSSVLNQILNEYDLQTKHFFRWKIEYSQQELSKMIADKSGINFGEILDLIPKERGSSGRITRLEIKGTNRTITFGKELMIRRLLSKTHLYSSAFYVEKEVEKSCTIPTKFTLFGAGWGHGVGLCQIGAAVMANKGYSYDKILKHYYPNSTITSTKKL